MSIMPVIPLGWIAMAVGIIIVIPRLGLLISPDWGRRFVRKFFGFPPFARGMGLLLLLISLATMKSVVRTSQPYEIIMLLFSFLWLFGGVILIVRPARYLPLADYFLNKSDNTLRALAALGVLLGTLFFCLGAFVYTAG